MKILMAVPTLGGGGAERVAATLVNTWRSEGHEVKLVVFERVRNQYSTSAPIVVLHSKAHQSASRKLWTFGSRIRQLSKVINDERPDVMVSFLESMSIPVILAHWLSGTKVKVIVSIRNNPLRFPWYYQIAMKVLYRYANFVVSPSKGIQTVMESVFRIPRNRSTWIPNPINIREIREKASRAPGPPFRYLIGVGRFVPQKGFDILIQAFATASTHIQERLLLIGEGPEEQRLRLHASALGIEDRVDFLGFLENPFPYVVGARCYVLSSRFEGWPNVLVEAMSLGCPTIAFDCPYGPREILENGDNGFLIPLADRQALAAVIQTLCTNNDLRNTLADKGRRRALQFDVARVGKKWLDLFSSLCG